METPKPGLVILSGRSPVVFLFLILVQASKRGEDHLQCFRILGGFPVLFRQQFHNLHTLAPGLLQVWRHSLQETPVEMKLFFRRQNGGWLGDKTAVPYLPLQVLARKPSQQQVQTVSLLQLGEELARS